MKSEGIVSLWRTITCIRENERPLFDRFRYRFPEEYDIRLVLLLGDD